MTKLEPSGRAKKTITVDPVIWGEFELACTRLGITFGQGVDEGIVMWMKQPRRDDMPKHLRKIVELLKERVNTDAKADALMAILKGALQLCD